MLPNELYGVPRVARLTWASEGEVEDGGFGARSFT